MERQEFIAIDNIQVNKRTIQNAYDNAKSQNKTYEVLSQVFRLINLSKISQVNPNDRNTKDMMKNIVNSQFIPQNYEDQVYKNKLDLSEAFPLNKLGTFNRQLERKCRLTQKGLMQFEDNKPAKPKDIKTFTNRIQQFGEKSIDIKIGWLADNKKYPFRIIIIDKSDGHKGIYFANRQKAQLVRIFLTQNFRYGGNFPKIISQANKLFLDQNIESFKNKLILRKRMINKSNRYSRNVITDDKNRSVAESQVRNMNQSNVRPYNQPPNTSVFYNPPNNQNRPIQQSNNGQMYKMSRLLETKSNQQSQNAKLNKFRDVQYYYGGQFLRFWRQKAQNMMYNKRNQPNLNPNLNQNLNQRSNLNNNYLGNSLNNQASKKSLYGGSSIHNSRRLVQGNKKQVDNESIFRGLQSSYIKQSNIKQSRRQQENTQQLFCYTIQFLTLKNLFFKPIVTIELVKKNRVEQSVIYNTIIMRKQPNLSYQLISSEQQSLIVRGNLRDYDISIKVIDFLANEEILNDRITMHAKKIIENAVLASDNKLVKLELSIKSNESPEMKQTSNQAKNNIVQLAVPPLSEEVKQKITNFWEKQSQSQGYYNQSNLTIYKILSQIQSPPLTWWKGVKQDDFQILQIFNNASKILGFKMIRSIPHIVKAFQKIYPDLQQMVVKAISFIITFLRPYYFPQFFNKIQRFHRALGLDDDCEFISKINLEIITIQKLVEMQCPTLYDKLLRKNISYGYQFIQYIYEAFSRNFVSKSLIELWNNLYTELDILQLNMILTAVALMKYYEQDLMKAKRFKDFCLIMQSQKMNKASFILKEISNLKQKYFSQVKGGFLDQIKNIFNSKPLQPILFDFYRRQTFKIDKRKSNKQIQKKSILRKVNKQIQIQLPIYDHKKYCLHIYFRRLPNVGGSLMLRSNDVEYECMNHQKNRYFIIGEVSKPITLVFLDLKSNEYTCQLQFNQGINQFTVNLVSPRIATVYKVIYIAGLLTQNQIQIFKRAKKFDHFLSPYVKQNQFWEEMNRPIHQADFLKKYDNNNSRDDLVKKIKMLFCSGSRSFNEIQFYIEQIQTSDLSIEQKIHYIKIYANNLSNEYSLCNNKIYEKQLFKLFLQKTGFQFIDNQYECFYGDSIQNQFDSPKIIKCRYHPQNNNNKQVKLQNQALSYFINRSSNYLYADIIVDQFINHLKSTIIEDLGTLPEGQLKLLYSSNGDIYLKTWLVKSKNKNKDIQFIQLKQDTVDDIEQVQINQPQILMTEILPSFAKISTILDYVNTSRNIDLKTKYQNKDLKKNIDNTNIIKDCQPKFQRVIPMRQHNYPQNIYIPFFLYYYELIKDFSVPIIKNIYLNNLKADVKSLCLLKGTLKFGQNAKLQSYTYQNQIGLYGNIRRLNRQAKAWFFFSYGHQQNQLKYQTGRVFANYGYGVFRWQPCYIVGYVMRVKQRQNSKSTSKSKPKKQFLVIVRGQQKYVKEYELELKPGGLGRIQQLQQSNKGNRYERSYFDDEEDRNNGSLKYLSKFIK